MHVSGVSKVRLTKQAYVQGGTEGQSFSDYDPLHSLSGLE